MMFASVLENRWTKVAEYFWSFVAKQPFTVPKYISQKEASRLWGNIDVYFTM